MDQFLIVVANVHTQLPFPDGKRGDIAGDDRWSTVSYSAVPRAGKIGGH